MAHRWLNLGLLYLLFGVIVGCSPLASTPVVTGPSYSELVVTYNAELETLDRLEAKREKLVAAFATASVASSGESANTISKLEGLLESAKVLKDGTGADLPTDPNELLDSLSQQSGEATEIAEQLLGGLLGGGGEKLPTIQPEPTPEEQAAAAERKAAFDAELASLEEELSKQKERVTRARNARDAAESK